MAKLHELLAIEDTLKGQAEKCRTDQMTSFEKKRHLFEEKKSVFTANTEGAQPVIENQSALETTVVKELDWLQGHIVKALDAAYQVDVANTVAQADIITEDEPPVTLAQGIPATALLQLEKRCAELHALVQSIPILDSAKGFRQDPNREPGVFIAREVVKTRTRKEPKVIVKYAATKEHPAQVELLNIDAPIGTVQEQEWSALITPARKAELLDRVEILRRAVRRARSRANEVAVDQTKKIGKMLLDYVFK